MSVEKIVAELRQVLDLLDLTALTQALDLIHQAELTFANAAQGSQQPEARQVLGLFAQSKQQLGQVYQSVIETKALVEQYLTNLVGGTGTGASTPEADRSKDRSPNRKSTGTTPDATTVTSGLSSDKQRQVRDVLATLPPEVPKPNPSGKKTHGKVMGSDEVIVSGMDDESAEVWQRLLKAGIPPRAKTMAVNHVEMKVAVRMIRSGAKHIEVVVNNQPCPGILGCRELLPIILPEGYRLTVHGPNYHGTFEGGEKWSS
ncbi:DddA-like double-stranded DNA deaminase toxin [Actinokineospora sp. 24-640]